MVDSDHPCYCTMCSGKGKVKDDERCECCDGEGQHLESTECDMVMRVNCNDCNGSGRVDISKDCSRCDGTGKNHDDKNRGKQSIFNGNSVDVVECRTCKRVKYGDVVVDEGEV